MRPSILCVLACLGIAPLANAQNLLINGDFAADLSGWNSPMPGLFTWDGAVDADMDSNSGAGHLLNQNSVASGGSYASQCVPVVGGEVYDFGAEIHFDSGLQTATGFAHVLAVFLDEPSCTGDVVEGVPTKIASADDTDSWILREALGVEAPPAAESAEFSLYVTKWDTTGTLAVDFDNARLTPVPEPSAAGMVSVALLALGWIRRPRETRKPAEFEPQDASRTHRLG